MLKQGYHRIRIGFPGGKLSCSDQDGCKIVFINSPPVIAVKSQPGPEPDTRIIKGKAASEVQKPAIILNVTGKTLKWRSNVENRQPVTVILRDEKQIGTSLSDEYKIKKESADKRASYRVEQEDEKGRRYTSNTVTTSDTITNSIGARFVYIPPGTFMMGSPENEARRYNNQEKLHKVTLTKGFYMQTTEVTQGQWKTVMGENPSKFQECGDDCPVETVSWDDVQEFIRKLNQMDKKRTGTYRLPTEAEWEYACRAGSVSAYSFGDNPDELEQYAWYDKNSDKMTHPVGRKAANAFGLYDMHGNVWEWCQDWYGNYPSDAATDPTGPHIGPYRVSRGGSWDYAAQYCRSAGRKLFYFPGIPIFFGFRLVLFPSQQ